jgi:hypothetical protein
MGAASVISTAAMKAISNPAVAAFRRRNKAMRPDALIDIHRRWRELPSTERL